MCNCKRSLAIIDTVFRLEKKLPNKSRQIMSSLTIRAVLVPESVARAKNTIHGAPLINRKSLDFYFIIEYFELNKLKTG